MDEDTKLVLQMWRVQVMVNDHLQRQEAGLLRRIAKVEKELEDIYAGCDGFNCGAVHRPRPWRCSCGSVLVRIKQDAERGKD
jgi:uncharacterized Fe-S cluster-containing protein